MGIPYGITYGDILILSLFFKSSKVFKKELFLILECKKGLKVLIYFLNNTKIILNIKPKIEVCKRKFTKNFADSISKKNKYNIEISLISPPPIIFFWDKMIPIKIVAIENKKGIYWILEKLKIQIHAMIGRIQTRCLFSIL